MAKRPPPPRRPSAQTQTEKTNIFQAPRPKGPNPGPIARSEPYRPRQRVQPDPEEEAAFGGRETTAREARETRRVSQAALAQGGLSPAKLRQLGIRLQDDEGDEQEEDGNLTQEEYDEKYGQATQDIDAAAPNLAEQMNQAMMPPPVPTFDEVQHWQRAREAATHELKQYHPQQQALQPSPMQGAPPLAHPTAQYIPPQPLRTEQAGRFDPSGAVVHPSGLAAHALRVGDIDRLWDWIRADRQDEVKAFLGRSFTTSVELHQFLWMIASLEPKGLAVIRALYWGHEHFGFAMLAPILAQERTALMHLYLTQQARGSLFNIAGPLVDVASRVLPGVHLAVSSLDQQWAKLHRAVLQPLGFVEHTMFVR